MPPNTKTYPLDMKDKKILYELDINARQPYSEIAKKVGLSKHAVKYRIENMIRNGIIINFTIITNLTRLGFPYYRLHFQLQNVDKKKEAEIIGFLRKNKHIAWLVSCDGKHDLLAGTIAKDAIELHSILMSVINKYNKYILNYEVVSIIRLVAFNRGYWFKEIAMPQKAVMVGVEGKKTALPKVDELDKKILSLLATNSRMPASKIAKEVGASSDTVSYRIKMLLKNKIISKFFVQLNHKGIKAQLYKTLLHLHHLDEKGEKELARFAEMHPYILDYVRTIAPWEMELDLEARDNEHYHEMMMEIRSKFSHLIKDYETLYVIKEHKFNYFPL